MPSFPEAIKVVIDTNVMISALLWEGISHRLLEHVESGMLRCYATLDMLDELAEVLRREKFAKRIAELKTSADELMLSVLQRVNLVEQATPVALPPSALLEDENDVMFLQCALLAEARYLISGDPHLLVLGQINEVTILSPSQFLHELEKLEGLA